MVFFGHMGYDYLAVKNYRIKPYHLVDRLLPYELSETLEHLGTEFFVKIIYGRMAELITVAHLYDLHLFGEHGLKSHEFDAVSLIDHLIGICRIDIIHGCF